MSLASLSGSVGSGGRNLSSDVQKVQTALNQIPADEGGPASPLTVNGNASAETIDAIKRYQRIFFGTLDADGRIDVGGRTFQALAGRLHLKRIEVNLTTQVLIALEDGKTVFQFECLTGDHTHQTDLGTFSVFRKQNPCRSITYNVEMDFALFFTYDGKAIHKFEAPAGTLHFLRFLRQQGTGDFGSHGCVRLEEDPARKIFNWAPLQTRVTVVK